jgi:hypothetical protein
MQQPKYLPFDQIKITQIDEYNFILVKSVMVKDFMPGIKVEQLLISFIQKEAIKLCHGINNIKIKKNEFVDGIRASHGYTLRELKKRNFVNGFFKQITTSISCTP